MKRNLSFFLILALSVISCSLVMAEPAARGFGFGGAMGMAFFPNMSGINAFMSENGLPSMGSFLVGAGGNGRGGVIGDLVFGGVGWGLVALSENDEASAELVSAGGGFDLGAAIGGDATSVLTLGAVLGGGSNILSLTTSFSADSDESGNTSPCGIVPTPISREVVHINGFVQPYVSMSAQLLPWMGFEFRLGYIFPIVGFGVGDLVGIPAPSLAMCGPTVSFGLAFGGIGPSEAEREARMEEIDDTADAPNKKTVSVSSEGTFPIGSGDELVIENTSGELTITSYAVDAADTPGDLIVQWTALRTARAKRIDELQVVVEDIETGVMLHSAGPGSIDYTIQVPAGIDLKVKNGAGYVAVRGHEAQTIIVENGVGGISLESLDAAALIVSGEICEIEMADINAQTLLVDLRLGWINIDLPVDTSARLLAEARVGNVSLDRFPGMTGGVHGFIGKAANATLGFGERMIELNVRLGEIGIHMAQP